MKKKTLSSCTIIGLLIYAIFQIANHLTKISDVIAIPTYIVSITFMMIGTAYHGWCFGKRKNPFSNVTSGESTFLSGSDGNKK